jgi:HSP20 family protein
MAETRTNETESANVRQASRSGNGGGTQQDQNQPTNQQAQSGSLTRQGSEAGTSRGLTRTGSRQLSQSSQHPFSMMRQLSRDMDRLFDSFFGTGLGSGLWGGGGREALDAPTLWSPQIDVQRRDDALVLKADLPGVSKEDLKIDIDDNTLVISGQRQEEHEEGGKDEGYQLYERSYGSFYREVPLPQDVNPDDIQAEMRDGVLKVTVPLPQSARRRRIEIRS